MLVEWRLGFLGSGAQFTVNYFSFFIGCISRLKHKGLFVGNLVLMTAFLAQYGSRKDRRLDLVGFVIMNFVVWEMKEI